jgi:hypothetical protein
MATWRSLEAPGWPTTGSGRAENEHELRDIQVRVEGPAAGFAQNWLLTTGEILSGHESFPVIPSSGDVAVQPILSSPSSGAGAAGTMYLIAVQCARAISTSQSVFHS